MKFIRLIPLIFLLSDACIERYDVPLLLSSPRLVVDGMITDEPGPYTIWLSKSVDVNSSLNNPVAILNATVRILDDAGNVETLVESAPGMYQTSVDGIRGVVGRKYHITINTTDKEYFSEPQELLPAGEISDLYYTFAAGAINPDDLSKPQDVFDIYIDARGTAAQSNLFRWRWSAVYEVKTFPELRTIEAGRPPQVFPNPLPCSGYRPGFGGVLERFDTCTCCNCWAFETGDRAMISNNQFVNNDQFDNVFIARIPIGANRFDIKYYFKVDQMSVSNEIYAFWKLVKAQQDGQGSLFQPNSIKVKGNIKSSSHPDEEVLGVFAVSAVTSRDIFIERKDVPVIIPMDSVKGSCLGYKRGSVNVRPSFW